MQLERLHNCRAFTLMELSVALVVFLIGILGLLQLVVFGVNVNQRNRDTTIATALSQAKADELLRAPFTSGTAARQLDIGGVIPAPNTNPFAAGNPAPVPCYTEFFDYDGNRITAIITQPCTLTGTVAKPANAYFMRQWQVWACDASCGATTPCTAACAGASQLRRITVTTTGMSPAFGGSFSSAAMVVYKTRIG